MMIEHVGHVLSDRIISALVIGRQPQNKEG